MAQWSGGLMPASFNGIPFYIQTGDTETGHRVSTTLVPNGRHINESFGPSPRKWSLEAYCTGAACYANAESLVTAAAEMHIGLLSLPDGAPAMVRLTKATRKFDKDKLGLAAVTIEATAEPDGMFGGVAGDVLALLAYGAVPALVSAIGMATAGALRLSAVPQPVLAAVVNSGADALADIEAMRLAARLTPEQDAAVAPAFAAALAGLPSLPDAPAEFAELVVSAAVALADQATPLVLAHWLRSAPLPAPASAPGVSRTAVAIASNADALAALTAMTRAAMLAEGLIRQEFADRGEAQEAQAVLLSVADDAVARLGPAGLEAGRLLRQFVGSVGQIIAVRAARLSDVITVSAPATLPSLWWAWMLYADPTRADDLATRAGARNPAAMPRTFEALAL